MYLQRNNNTMTDSFLNPLNYFSKIDFLLSRVIQQNSDVIVFLNPIIDFFPNRVVGLFIAKVVCTGNLCVAKSDSVC